MNQHDPRRLTRPRLPWLGLGLLAGLALGPLVIVAGYAVAHVLTGAGRNTR